MIVTDTVSQSLFTSLNLEHRRLKVVIYTNKKKVAYWQTDDVHLAPLENIDKEKTAERKH